MQTEATEVMELTVLAEVPICATNDVPKKNYVQDVAVAIIQYIQGMHRNDSFLRLGCNA